MIHKTKKEEGKIGPFYPLRWEFRLFRPFQSPADTDWYGWYGPILAESARFGANQSRIGANRAESVRIRKKKKAQTWHQREGNRVGLGCGTLPAASVLSSSPLNMTKPSRANLSHLFINRSHPIFKQISLLWILFFCVFPLIHLNTLVLATLILWYVIS